MTPEESTGMTARFVEIAARSGGDPGPLRRAVAADFGRIRLRARFEASAQRFLGSDATDEMVVTFVEGRSPPASLTLAESARRLMPGATKAEIETFVRGR